MLTVNIDKLTDMVRRDVLEIDDARDNQWSREGFSESAFCHRLCYTFEDYILKDLLGLSSGRSLTNEQVDEIEGLETALQDKVFFKLVDEGFFTELPDGSWLLLG